MSQHEISDARRYLTRPPERLVLEGYRHWTQSVITASSSSMDDANDLYRDILGTKIAKPAFIAMADFVQTLGLCAKCPLHMYEVDTPSICTDETLILGLISGIQNGDDKAVELCLTTLTCASRCDQVAMAAGSFALILKGADKTLLPISRPMIASILSRPTRAALPTTINLKNTLH